MQNPQVLEPQSVALITRWEVWDKAENDDSSDPEKPPL